MAKSRSLRGKTLYKKGYKKKADLPVELLLPLIGKGERDTQLMAARKRKKRRAT